MSGLAQRVFSALLSAVDEERLEAALSDKLGSGGDASASSESFLDQSDENNQKDGLGTRSNEEALASEASLHGRLLLTDLLGDDIVGARSGDPSFPIRIFISKLGESLDDDTAFALASGLSFYFRATMDEEAQVRVGLEVSRLYYSFASASLDVPERKAVSPLLARLMSGDLERLRFEAVDNEPVFDSAEHERGPRADASSSGLTIPETFLCRVAANGMVRFKAVVTT